MPIDPSRCRRRRIRVAAVALAALVVVSCGDGDGDGGGDVDLSDVQTSPSLEVVGTEMAFTPDRVAVAEGTVEVTLRNEGSILHDLRIEEVPFLVEARPGETVSDTVELDAGRYDIYCSLPGHRRAGMEGVLEVR